LTDCVKTNGSKLVPKQSGSGTSCVSVLGALEELRSEEKEGNDWRIKSQSPIF